MRQTVQALGKRVVVFILTQEARLLLWRKRPTIIAITGSVGKTSTKDAIYAAIKDSVPARKSQKSFNSELGVPLTILGLPTGWSNPLVWIWNLIDGAATALFARSYPGVLVLEAGVDAPGDMSALTKWLRPDIVVLTRLPDVPVHVEQFASPEAVVAEKMQLVRGLASEGTLVYNADDPTIMAEVPDVRQTAVGYARYTKTDVTVGSEKIEYHDTTPTGMRATVTTGDTKHELTLSGVVGTQLLYAAAAAVAVAERVGVATEAAVAGLATLNPAPGRLRVVPGLKGSVLIDDTYNASPIAVASALETLAQIKHAKRRIAVLGDMLELGRYSAEEHHRIGQQVARTCDCLMTVGVRARGIAAGALSAGMNEANILQYEHADRTGRELQNLLQPGDVVLVKGSQSVRLERVVLEVMAEPQRAAELLVRQDAAWQRR